MHYIWLMVTKQHILVVEDHEALNAMLCRALRLAGHEVSGVLSVEDLQEHPAIMDIDTFVIDWNLPGEDGLSFAARLRKQFPDVGIIVASARAGISNQLQGYANGADIYLTKPFSGEALIEAVHILAQRKVARISVKKVSPNVLGSLDRSQSLLEVADRKVQLSFIEQKLLIAFATAQKQNLETWQIIEIVEAVSDSQQTARAIEVRLSRLRKKLCVVFGDGNHLAYMKGQGYRLMRSLTIH